MTLRAAKISAILLSLTSVLLVTDGWSATSLNGSAELLYAKYDVAENSKDLFSGSSLAQQYSLSYTASNLYYRNQPRYYNLMVGYDMVNFDTKITQPDHETEFKQSYGRMKYSGEVAYKAAAFPLRFKVYINDNTPLNLQTGIAVNSLLADRLAYNIQGRSKTVSSGVSMAFEPETSRNGSIRALPKLYLEYRDITSKSSEGLFPIDSKLRELAVAGLNKENNWVNYRFSNYENNLQPLDNYSLQQIQIGLVDQKGRRKWSSLTNWIEVSADGQLTTKRAVESLDEYDVNFMAIATRRTWEARTFMNYNRIMKTYANLADDELTENASIPLYIKGIYGPETDWYMRVSAARGTQTLFKPTINKETSYSNMVSLGGTTFKRSEFSLSPSLVVTTSKGFSGSDALELAGAVETNSTARYSNKVGLAARLEMKYQDDGTGTQSSKSWYNTLKLNANYRPDSKFSYVLNQQLEIADTTPEQLIVGYHGTKKYLKTLTLASVVWTPKAAFNTALDVSYELRKNEDNVDTNEMLLSHRLFYDKKETSYRLDTKVSQKNNYYGQSREIMHTGNFQYRPDRYNDALIRYIYTENRYDSSYASSSRMDLIERYSYNFFTRAGVIRNLATISQEIGYVKNDRTVNNGGATTGKFSTCYLQLSGRYSPTERLSLYGSAKYANDNPGSTTLYYSAGLNADFKLLSTSLDYGYAKRDTDNRIEKRLNASVKRTF